MVLVSLPIYASSEFYGTWKQHGFNVYIDIINNQKIRQCREAKGRVFITADGSMDNDANIVWERISLSDFKGNSLESTLNMNEKLEWDSSSLKIKGERLIVGSGDSSSEFEKMAKKMPVECRGELSSKLAKSMGCHDLVGEWRAAEKLLEKLNDENYSSAQTQVISELRLLALYGPPYSTNRYFAFRSLIALTLGSSTNIKNSILYTQGWIEDVKQELTDLNYELTDTSKELVCKG